MKRFLQLILLLAMPAILMSGCKKDAGEDSVKVILKKTLITSGNQSFQIEVVSNTSWEIAPSQTWVTIEPKQGKGNAVCTVTVSDNITRQRSSDITATAGTAHHTVKFSQQGPNAFTLSREAIVFDQQGTPEQVTLSTAAIWQIEDFDIPWLSVSKTSGEGGETITLTPDPVTVREPRGPVDLVISSSGMVQRLTLSQAFPNEAPTRPTLTAPENNATFAEANVTFSWAPSTDPDGDDVFYSVSISSDGQKWSVLGTGLAEPSFEMSSKPAGLKFYWKVTAYDLYGGSTDSESRAINFSFSHYDGMVKIYKENAVPGAQPVNIVFIGDGYLEEDYDEGGSFEEHIKTCVDAMLAIEPFKTYKDYFRIYVVTAYSQERGVTILEDFTTGAKMKAQTKNSRFGSVCQGGNSTRITLSDVNSDLLLAFIKSLLEITDAELYNYPIFMTINVDAWAGTCMMGSSGYAIASSAADYNLGKRMVHEGFGHGFGRLLDEYISYPGETLPQSSVNRINSWRGSDPWYYAANIDITGRLDQVHWRDYFTRTGYERVGLIEGAYLYTYGAWRAEQTSIMQGSSSINYFNAPSREAIVRHIMRKAGIPFFITDFLARDNSIMPSRARTSYEAENYPPDTPPEMIDDLGVEAIYRNSR